MPERVDIMASKAKPYVPEGKEMSLQDLAELTVPSEIEELAIKLAAFDIMKQLYADGKITKNELQYIAQKHNVPVEKA